MVNGVKQATGAFPINLLRERAFYRIAWNVKNQWEENGGDTRLFMEPLIHDSLITVGQSIKGSDRREHVVPRVMIADRCKELYKEGKSVEEVAEFISRYLKIVLISTDEQKRLDKELKLMTRMPDGWSFNEGDPFARLHKAGIEFELFPAEE